MAKESKKTRLKDFFISLLPFTVGIETYRTIDRLGKIASISFELDEINSGRVPANSRGKMLLSGVCRGLGEAVGFAAAVGYEAFTYARLIDLGNEALNSGDYREVAIIAGTTALYRALMYPFFKSNRKMSEKQIDQFQKTIDENLEGVIEQERVRNLWRKNDKK